MKIAVLALAVTAGAAIGASANATQLANWTFESTIPAAAGPYAAENGVNASSSFASGYHASVAAVYSSPSGNGSSHSFSSNNWTAGDYYQFTTSATGYSSITIQWDQTSSNTGPGTFALFQSTNGSTFTQIGSNYTVLANASPNTPWNGTTYNAAYTFGPTAGTSALNNAGTIYFRLVAEGSTSANGGAIGTAGTDRVDNVTISGTQVPAPASIALVGLAGLVAGRRRRA